MLFGEWNERRKTAVPLLTRPFEVHHLPAALKLEVICSDESIDNIVKLLARTVRTGNRGDGIIAVQDVEKVLRIRDIEPLS